MLSQGTITQVIGPVVDVQFPAGELPAIHNALTIPADGHTVTVEVAQHAGGHTVRCVAMSSTDGLSRHMTVYDTGKPITVPVGRACLGRMLNVLG
ncbi:MAG: F0F1 ATP synthase subunit beta, partial [Oscillibacter sp.]